METKGERRERKRQALRGKGQKHNYARWKQVIEGWVKRARPQVETPPEKRVDS
ncbi:MAG: hypothetical protein AB1603_01495 [Chloroflexota bacterium]